MALEELPIFMAAIRRLESGSYEGNYGAMGVMTSSGHRARGAYQIMEQYWAGWAAEAGLAGADWRSRKAQDAVARHRMTKLYEEFGSWDLVAIAWFAGPSKARRAAEQGLESVAQLRDVVGTSVGKYVARIGNYMREAPAEYKDAVSGPQLEVLGAKRRAPTDFYAAVTDPNAALRDALDAGGEREIEPQDPMKGILAGILDRFSNAVAGGQRSAVGSAVEPRIIGQQEGEMV